MILKDWEKVVKLCKDNGIIPIVLMETDMAGQEVDNGMGVDFELSRFALIYRGKKKHDVMDVLARENILDEVNTFDINGCSSLDEMVEELASTDGYKEIYRNTDFREPEQVKADLIRKSVCVEVKEVRNYELLVPYSEIDKYLKETEQECYDRDLLLEILEHHAEKENVFREGRFNRDQVRTDGIIFCEGYLKFVFRIEWSEDKRGDGKDVVRLFEKKTDGKRIIDSILNTVGLFFKVKL